VCTRASQTEGFFNLFRHSVGLLWTSDRPVAKASTYAGQQNKEKLEQTSCLKRDTNPRCQRPSDQGLRLRPSRHWDRQVIIYFNFSSHLYLEVMSSLFLSRFPTKIWYIFLVLLSSSLSIFLRPPVTSSLTDPNIFLDIVILMAVKMSPGM
jgi:hypothetical protein